MFKSRKYKKVQPSGEVQNCYKQREWHMGKPEYEKLGVSKGKKEAHVSKMMASES